MPFRASTIAPALVALAVHRETHQAMRMADAATKKIKNARGSASAAAGVMVSSGS
jgi:hypothetical protein